MTQHIRLWELSHRQAAKSQTSECKYITIILNVMVLLLLMSLCLVFLSLVWPSQENHEVSIGISIRTPEIGNTRQNILCNSMYIQYMHVEPRAMNAPIGTYLSYCVRV